MPSLHDRSLARISDRAMEEFSAKHASRERGVQISREVIRLSANAIRNVHRQEFDQARELIRQADIRLKEAAELLKTWPEIYHSGFLSDARKEYSEAAVTLALISGASIPEPQEIGVEMGPYLNGMGEVIGELRRFILDSLRRDDTKRCEELMEIMDEIYGVLVTMDFPEGVTAGLRHTTDAMRGILERTRGDLTMAIRQRQLERKLTSLTRDMGADKEEPG